MRNGSAERLLRSALYGCLLCACTASGQRPKLVEVDQREPSSSAESGFAGASGGASEEALSEAEGPDGDEPETIGDETEDVADARIEEPDARARAHPLDGWDDAKLRSTARTDLALLGSISLGQPNGGALLNGVQAESSSLFELVDKSHAHGTQETVDYLRLAIGKVHAEFPDTPPLSLGHISAARGGPLKPHISHQSGRDVDISFYYADKARWYARASEKNLDYTRTWAFIRALITETDVEMILIDHSVQAWLKRYALGQGEDPDWIEGLFRGSGERRAIIRHAPGHDTHIHIRFYNPIAQETARRAQSALVAERVVPEIVSVLRYRAKRGDTLGKIAKRFSVSVPAIKRANGLRSSKIREQREYRIPVAAPPPPPARNPLKFPARRLPPRPPSPQPVSLLAPSR